MTPAMQAVLQEEWEVEERYVRLVGADRDLGHMHLFRRDGAPENAEPEAEARALLMANALRMVRLLQRAPDLLEPHGLCPYIERGAPCHVCGRQEVLRLDTQDFLRDLGIESEPAEASR